MSEIWMTSGRRRLRYKEGESIAQRAKARAAFMGYIPKKRNRAGKGSKNIQRNHPRFTKRTSFEALGSSWSCPLARRGIVAAGEPQRTDRESNGLQDNATSGSKDATAVQPPRKRIRDANASNHFFPNNVPKKPVPPPMRQYPRPMHQQTGRVVPKVQRPQIPANPSFRPPPQGPPRTSLHRSQPQPPGPYFQQPQHHYRQEVSYPSEPSQERNSIGHLFDDDSTLPTDQSYQPTEFYDQEYHHYPQDTLPRGTNWSHQPSQSDFNDRPPHRAPEPAPWYDENCFDQQPWSPTEPYETLLDSIHSLGGQQSYHPEVQFPAEPQEYLPSGHLEAPNIHGYGYNEQRGGFFEENDTNDHFEHHDNQYHDEDVHQQEHTQPLLPPQAPSGFFREGPGTVEFTGPATLRTNHQAHFAISVTPASQSTFHQAGFDQLPERSTRRSDPLSTARQSFHSSTGPTQAQGHQRQAGQSNEGCEHDSYFGLGQTRAPGGWLGNGDVRQHHVPTQDCFSESHQCDDETPRVPPNDVPFGVITTVTTPGGGPAMSAMTEGSEFAACVIPGHAGNDSFHESSGYAGDVSNENNGIDDANF
ncbi:expressed unknown protein [Seminavis robusta]|uniref:Uncharacterized protein n=1 Tax=Seminavis robusta TaxID=568900 RepID=A0A9N8DM98_9STRA|nr:expressed unknown protein [Seminavis robusta]|eukprot:Sro157_g071180.1 n/a (587) ;mRNA; f:49758-51620